MAFQECFQIQFWALIVEKSIIAFEIVALATGGLGVGPIGLGGLVADDLD